MERRAFLQETFLQYSKVTVLTRRYSFRAASPARQQIPWGKVILTAAPRAGHTLL